MISYLGEGLNIVISCDHIPGHNWMSYLCWYSIKQNLPDSQVSIICKRNNVSGNLFLWTKKLNIPFRMYSDSNTIHTLLGQTKPNLIVSPYCMAIRDFEEAKYDISSIKKDESIFIEDTKLICDCRFDDFCVFCSYKTGWGHFITKDWLNKVECPLSFFILKKFSKDKMSLNEKRIESLWSSSLRLFQAVSGGTII